MLDVVVICVLIGILIWDWFTLNKLVNGKQKKRRN